MSDSKINYGVQLSQVDRAALEAIARQWQVKPSQVIRITIRALAETVHAQEVALALGPTPSGAPSGQGVADDH